jgi:hypothetical protein
MLDLHYQYRFFRRAGFVENFKVANRACNSLAIDINFFCYLSHSLITLGYEN